MTVCSSGAPIKARRWGAALSVFIFMGAAATLSTPAAQAQRGQMDRQPGATQMQRQPASPQMGQERGSAPSQARGEVSAEFRTALEPHGRFQRHSRWGEVWVPANRSRDWRPYTVGRWAYTNDWGWYWIEDASEASWGTVTYHYGRWIYDDDVGWCWLAGNEWAPAWVLWRRGERAEYVGWAPLPPDDIVVDYYEAPRFWIFVRGRDFVAPRIASMILPVQEYDVYLRDTVVVNRTLLVSDREHFAVNPGIAPNVVAAFSGQPVRSFNVRPVVLAGTAALIAGAVQVRAQDLRRRDFRPPMTLQLTQNVIRPTDRVPQAQPLAAGERGRLGDSPPRAAQRAQGAPPTVDQTPGGQQPQPQQQGQQQRQQQPQQQQQRPQQQQGQPQQQGLQKEQQPAQPQQGRAKQELPQTQGKGLQKGEPQSVQPQGGIKQETPAQQQGRTKQEAPVTQGRGADEQRQQQQGRGKEPQRQLPAVQQRQGREGAAAEPKTQRPAAAPQQQQPQTERSRPSARPEQGTIGRGGGEPSRAAPQQRNVPSAGDGRERGGSAGPTEGRGGGGGGAALPQGGRGGGGAASGAERGGPGPR